MDNNLDLSFNYLHPARTSLEPQNLLRVTNKGCSSCAKGVGLLNNGVVRMATRPLAGLGTDPVDETEPVVDEQTGGYVRRLSGFSMAVIAVSTVSAVVSAYHGYKRNDSLGWAIVWWFMGAWFPVITPTIAIAQGYAKPYRAGVRGFDGRMKRALKRAKRRK